MDIRVLVGRRIPEVVEFVLRCEEAGFHGVGVHDHHSGRDVCTSPWRLRLPAPAISRSIRLTPSRPVTRCRGLR